ncbi:MAG: homocysteine S-methyltransferase family protein [Flexilinea sp.]
MFKITDKIIILDGAMGTLLQSMGLMTEKVPEAINLTNPEAVTDIHRRYIRSGAEIIYSNTLGVNGYKLSDSGYSVEQLISAAVRNAKSAIAAENPETLIALDCGPIGTMLKPNGDLSFEEAYDIFREIVVCGEKAGVNLIVFETFTDLLEIKAAILAAKEYTSLPVFACMSFEANGRTFSGVSVPCAAVTLTALGVDAVGINCSLGPEQILPLAEEMTIWTNLPMIVKPNAGMPNLKTGGYDITPDAFVEAMSRFPQIGINLIGGCCGTTPEFIEKIRDNIKSNGFTKTLNKERTVLCSSEKIVEIDGVRIVGERINPTGKKRFKTALINHDIEYILRQALEQTAAGAEILDVNVGIPGIDEPGLMAEVVEAIQSICDAPLQIDSSDPKAIEAALRIYNGKPLVNSVNGEDKVLHTILPIVKKYGAAVIGLTLDEKGIPQTAEERVLIAKKIIDTAASYGIPKQDVVIDCLTLTVSAQQNQALETLRALREVKTKFGVKTVLGVSNVSFGLPDRETVNTAFLTMALASGLDLPIINPNNPQMTGAIDAFNVLSNLDENAGHYISAHNTAKTSEAMPVSDLTLEQAVENGIKQAAANATLCLMQLKSATDIIDNSLIPSLEKVGNRFERGEIFLPQLIQSATAAQASFEIIKKEFNKNKTEQDSLSKGKIILATVKGDIHDIGKNIVKVILENSGYEIIDLGKNVPIEKIVDSVKENKVRLVGLSALMTTTVKNMETTIQRLRAETNCTILVGGAVLTEDYALSIGADYYAKDAKTGMDIAKKVLG